MDLDAYVTARWTANLNGLWSDRLFAERERQGPLLRALEDQAPSTRWGKAAPEQVDAMVRTLEEHTVTLVPGEVLLHGRIPVAGLVCLGYVPRVAMALGTLVVGEQHYDLTPAQTDRMKALAAHWEAEKARHLAQTPTVAQANALREEGILRDAMRSRPAEPSRRRRGSSRSRRDDGNSLGSALGSNSFGSW